MVKNLVTPFRYILSFKSLLKSSVKNEVKQKYAGSVIGLIWALLYPVLLFCIYTTLYLFVFRVKPLDMDTNGYIVYIMSGLLPFVSFSEALSSGTTSLSGKKSLLLNTVYPSEFIPLQAVISSHITIFVGTILLIITDFLLRDFTTPCFVMSFFLILAQIMFVAGITWILSILNLLIRDIQQAITFVCMLIMIISPIAYTPAMVPSSLRLIITLNPFSYFVSAYQSLFISGTIGSSFIVSILLGMTSFVIGFYFYSKTKKVFYEFA